jgi:hypothetical protein
VDFDTEIKLSIYRHFAETARRPSAAAVAERSGAGVKDVPAAFARLREKRVLVLEPGDEGTIRMAPPFSGVPTQHRVIVAGLTYDANCAWDAMGIPAALHQPGIIESRCEQSREPLHLEVALDGPGASDWLFHCAVPASHWWDDVVFT